MYDIAIIGAGPAGYNAAERAAENGLKTIIFEKSNFGGVCLNEGCIPTKSFLQSAKIYEYTKSASKYGISMENGSYDFSKILKRKNKIVKKLTLGIKKKLEHKQVEMILANAKLVSNNNGITTIEAAGETYKAKHVLIATGSDVFIPNFPGKDQENVISSKEMLNLKELPESMCIVGAGVIGMEFGSFLSSMGVKVSFIELMPRCLPNIDEQASSMLQANLEKRACEFHYNARMLEISEKTLVYEQEGEKKTLNADMFLISIGRKANINDIGIENLGIKTEKGAITTDQYCKTNIENIYAIGDVNGKMMLAHTAYREGEMVMNLILNKKDELCYANIPNVVYSNPEIASIGISETEAKEANIDYKLVNLPMSFAGRFMIDNELFNGLFKMVIIDNKVKGIVMCGNGSSEIITTASHIVNSGMTLEEARKIVYPHPTSSEIIREALFEI